MPTKIIIIMIIVVINNNIHIINITTRETSKTALYSACVVLHEVLYKAILSSKPTVNTEVFCLIVAPSSPHPFPMPA